MPQEDRNLRLAELEDHCGQPLFVRALSKQTQLLEPSPDTGGFPSISVSGNQELMPVSAARVTRDFTPELPRAGCHRGAVLLRTGGVPQRLVLEIAAVADEVSE